MILKEATIKYSGRDPNTLTKGSHVKVCCSCDECGRVRWVIFQSYRDLCSSCSLRGKNNSNLGKSMSDEQKLKISKSKSGIRLSEYEIKICEVCKKEFEVIPSKKNAKFCCKKCVGKWQSENLSGKNSRKYNFNITDEERLIRRHIPGYKEWRIEVYKRDNFTCQKCNDSTGGNLQAHHLESYANNKKLRTNLENGVTLCEKCHKNFHQQFGRGNNTKEQFIEFMVSYK